MKNKKLKVPYLRDIYLATLIEGARKTEFGYPIIEKWMVATDIPTNIVQRNVKSKFKENSNNAISFYCNDNYFIPIILNLDKYVDILKKLQMCYRPRLFAI